MSNVLTLTEPMVVSALIMGLTFFGIFTEGLHKFHRAKFAMLGALAMIVAGQIYGFYSPELAVAAIDWNVVFLLGAMMTIVLIMIPTGGFQALAYKIADLSKGRLFLMMVLLGTAVSVISLLLDNVTTVVIFGPLIVLISQALKVSPLPYLLASGLLSNTGGVATLIGDPPNIMIGSAADIDFNTFFLHMFPVVLIAYITSIIILKYLFKKELAIIPYMTDFTNHEKMKDPKTWRVALYILALVVVLFMMHDYLHWDVWVAAALGLTMLVFLAPRVDMNATFEKLELTLLIFFIALFMIVGGVEQTQFLQYLGQYIQPFVERDLFTATIVLMWAAAILSAMIDNIPFTAAMVPIILGFESQGINITPLWWGLAIGVGMGGNGTHLGSTANVFIVTLSERIAKEQNDPSLAITPGLWFKRGTPVMIGTLITSSFMFWIFFDYLK